MLDFDKVRLMIAHFYNEVTDNCQNYMTDENFLINVKKLLRCGLH